MKKEFIKDSTFSLVTHILVYVKGIFLIPIIVKTVGVSVYGSFTLLTSMVGIIFGISSLGVGTKSCRCLSSAKTSNQKAKLFYPQFYFQISMLLLIFVVILIFQKQLTAFISEEQSIFIIYIVPFYLLFYALYAHVYSYLKYTSRIWYMNIISISYAYGHVCFILLYNQFIDKIDINILFISQGLAALLVASPFIFLIYKEISFKFLFFKVNEIREQIKIGFPLVLNLIVDFILAASDRFVLAYFMGTIAVGLYVPAYVIGSVILLVPKAIGTVVPQLMFKSVDSDNFAQAKSLFFNSIKVFMVVTVPFIFGIYLIGYEILVILSNEEVASDGKYIATIIALSSLFYGFNILMSQANMVDLKTGVIFRANFIAAILNLVLNILLLFFIQSIYIPAITTLLSFMVASVYFYKSLDLKWVDSRVLILFMKICFISLIMFLFVSAVEMILPTISIMFDMLIKVLLAVLIYSILILIFKIYTMEQIKNMKVIFGK